MYKILREKVASSVTDVETPEHFVWAKWLREPTSESLPVENIISVLYNQENLCETIPSASSETFKIKITRPKLFDKSKKYIIPKAKSNKIFFKLVSTSNNKIVFNNPNDGKILFSSSDELILKANKNASATQLVDIETSSKTSVKKFKNKIVIDPPKTSEHLKSINTEIRHIELWKLEETSCKRIDLLEFDNNLLEIIKLDLDKVELPQTHNIDLGNLEKLFNDTEDLKTEVINVPLNLLYIPSIKKVKILDEKNIEIPTYFLKNVIFQKTKVSKNYFDIFSKTEVIELPIPDECFEEQKLIIEDEIPIVDEGPQIDEQTPTENVERIFNSEESNEANYEEVEDLLNDNNIINELLTTSSNKENGNSKKETKKENKRVEKENENIKIKESTNVDEDINLNKNDYFDDFVISEEYLYDFQKEGTKNLLQNRFALLADELGVGKTFQAASALKVLFNENIIKTPLIVCMQNDIGDLEISSFTNEPNGWTGHFAKVLKEKSITIINGDKKERSTLWEKSDSILVISYKDFFEDLNQGNIPQKISKNIDCIIFDEAQEVLHGKLLVKNFIKAAKPQYVWYLSSQPGELIREELESLQKLSTPLFEIKRSKSDLSELLPKIVRQDVWFNLDEEQQIEYDNTLTLGRDRISKLVQAGNPFLIQSNVFTLIHQLKQVCNFTSAKKTSPKTDYLLKQIETIVQSKKKVLVFSQYDKLGTHRLEQLLKEKKIKFISYHSGMSLKEIDNAKKLFRKSKTTYVLINGIKISRSTVNLAEVPYVIYFDQWWNPASVWKTEDYINNPENDKLKISDNLNIYNYFTLNSIEEKIKKVLSRKGLLRKDIMGSLSAETINEIISTEEWLEILEISENVNNFESYSKKMDELSIKDLNKKIEYLFARLGYKNTTVEKSKREGEYDIIATIIQNNSKQKVGGKLLLNDDFSDEDLKELINKLKADKNSGKNLIIHLKDFSEDVIASAGNNFSFINKDLLTNYFINFRLI